jgi:hypothetical protein
VGVLLGIWNIYLGERLLRYVAKQYPEKGKVIRSYVWQMYPWSPGKKLARTLIKEHSPSDKVLASWVKREKGCRIYFKVWFVLALIMSFIRILLILAK